MTKDKTFEWSERQETSFRDPYTPKSLFSMFYRQFYRMMMNHELIKVIAVEESSLQDDYTVNDIAISANKEEGVQDKQLLQSH